VIGTKIGGIPEQVEDGKTGFLFEMGNVEQLADKMSVLSMDMEMRVGMGKAARHRVEKEYSLEDHCSQLIGIYKELLTKKL